MSLKPETVTITVTTAGTPVQVFSTVIYSPFVYFEADDGNTGVIFVGDSSVSGSTYTSRLAAKEGVSIGADRFGKSSNENIDLSTFWVDASVDAQVVQVTYLKKQDNL
jgi:hypothetical protein